MLAICIREEAKRKVFTGYPYLGFHTSGYRLQVPMSFHVVSPNLIHFSRSASILTTFYWFLYYVPRFWQFLCSGLLYWPPIFTLFIFQAASGTPVMLLPLTDSGFGTQLPPKIGSLEKTFLLAPLPKSIFTRSRLL